MTSTRSVVSSSSGRGATTAAPPLAIAARISPMSLLSVGQKSVGGIRGVVRVGEPRGWAQSDC